MQYIDKWGQRQRLTREQAAYLDLAARRSFEYGWGGMRSTQTVRLLEQRGLLVMSQLPHGSRWRVHMLSSAGQQVLDRWRERQQRP